MSALRPRTRGVFVDVSAAVSVAVSCGIRADVALALLSEFSSGVIAAAKKAADDVEAEGIIDRD
jgi:hypothetical protein